MSCLRNVLKLTLMVAANGLGYRDCVASLLGAPSHNIKWASFLGLHTRFCESQASSFKAACWLFLVWVMDDGVSECFWEERLPVWFPPPKKPILRTIA